MIAAHPGMLVALSGFGDCVVFRSPVVRTTDEIYRPVREFIEQNGLVEVDSETIVDPCAYMGVWFMTVMEE